MKGLKKWALLTIVFFAAVGLFFSVGAAKDVTLTISVLSGVHKNPFLNAAPLFEKDHPGVKINIVEYPFSDIYDKEMLEATSHSGAIDIYEQANGWVPDFAEGGFIIPLDKYFAKKNPALDDVFPAFEGLMKYNGKYFTLLLDGDCFMTYYRKDLFEDPKEKAAFRKKYGYALEIPKTWDRYADIAEFFTRDTDKDGEIDLWGSVMMLSRLFGSFTFIQFLHSYGGVYFNPATMDPGINSDAGMKGYEMIARLKKFGPPDMINWGYTEVRDTFERGDSAMMIQWNEITWEISETSKVKGKILYGPMPGVMIGGKLNNPALQAWGWCASISADSKNKDLAYEFLYFIAMPPVQLEIFAIPFNGLEPWRKSNFNAAAMAKWKELSPAAPAWLAGLQESVKNGVSDLRIPGMFEYYDVLGVQIGEALTGQTSGKAALDAAAAEWKKITERRGFDKQKRAYEELIKIKKK
jgi:multiple sugar transport system substrate-binding protein